jgi:Protein of unknown function (DUF3040)
MDSGKRLSLREQRILAEIETTLRRDRKLDDRLRNLRLPARFRMLAAQRRLRGAELGVLIPTTIVLSLTAAHTARLGVIIACGCVGAITMLLLAGVIRSRAERRRLDRLADAGERRRTAP